MKEIAITVDCKDKHWRRENVIFGIFGICNLLIIRVFNAIVLKDSILPFALSLDL